MDNLNDENMYYAKCCNECGGILGCSKNKVEEDFLCYECMILAGLESIKGFKIKDSNKSTMSLMIKLSQLFTPMVNDYIKKSIEKKEIKSVDINEDKDK